ncbi:hypothetical protein MNBD_GAMMA05-2234 [hydrothermal vent metagenome]|uniref:Outer membrane protein beta-barrel domain-containing protein n=1 Tax=hydrothermal vent metagenome TaxID=652676 RepID=A0A3B0WK37_9ZZZZ
MNYKNSKKTIILLILLFVFSATVSAASIGTGGLSTAFSKGNVNLGIVAGTGEAFRENYIILGVGAGYYVLNGLELGVDVQHWFSGNPAITKVSPQIKYVFTQAKSIKPYVGVFYRTTFIEDLNNENSFGYRLGAFFSGSNGVYIGGGIVYEEYENCSRFVDCSNTYPEIIISVSF